MSAIIDCLEKDVSPKLRIMCGTWR